MMPLLFAKRQETEPERFIVWEPSTVDERPALRPLADVLVRAASGEAQVRVTSEVASEILSYLDLRWEEKYPGMRPSPAMVWHEGAYYSVVLAV